MTKQSEKVKIEIPSLNDNKKIIKRKPSSLKEVSSKSNTNTGRSETGFRVEAESYSLFISDPSCIPQLINILKSMCVGYEYFEPENLVEKKELIAVEKVEPFQQEADTFLSAQPSQQNIPEQTGSSVREKEVVEVKPEESYTFCPICKSKLKKKNIKKSGDVLIQDVKCKNRKCGFSRQYRFSL